MTTIADANDPATFITLTDHAPIITAFDLYVTNPAVASISYSTYPELLSFSANLGFDNVHLNNDGFGDLVISVNAPNGDALSWTVYGFEQGSIMGGVITTLPSAYFDGVSEVTHSATASTPFVIPTAHGNFTFYDVSPTMYALRAMVLAGTTYDLTKGVPINGTTGDDTLTGFGVRAFTGQAFNDTLYGNAGNDELHGLAGNDKLYGGTGNDLLDGGDGNDLLDGGDGHDTAWLDYSAATAAVVAVNAGGAAASYTRIGGVLTDTLTGIEALNVYGGSGNDRIGGKYAMPVDPNGLFADTSVWLVGNDGTDTAVLDMSAADRVDWDGFFDPVLISANAQVTIRLSAVEAVDATGSPGDDVLEFGNLTADSVIRGGDGADYLSAGAGNDKLLGGAGADRLFGGRGNNQIDGGAGYDFATADFSDRTKAVVFINGAASGVTYSASVGGTSAGTVRDVEVLSVYGGSGNDRIGGKYTPSATGESAPVQLFGNGGIDTAVLDLSASSRITATDPYAIVVEGTGGTLTIAIDTEAVDVTGGVGGDILDFHGQTAASTIRGGDGGDDITGGNGGDKLYGGAGDDSLASTGNNALLDGGAGFDVARLDFFPTELDSVVAVNGGAAGATYTVTVGGVAHGALKDIELLNVSGGAGNDRLGGKYVVPTDGRSDAFILGWSGIDTAVLDLSAAGRVDWDGSFNPVMYSAGNHLTIQLNEIEAVDVTGSAGDDVLEFGNMTAASTIRGGAGNDYVSGGSGADNLQGGTGDDRIFGNRGNDSIDGGTGFDEATLDYADRTGSVVLVNGAVPGVTYSATVGGASAGSVRNVEALSVFGGSGNDRIGGTIAMPTDGQSHNVFLYGNAGTDTVVLDFSAAASVSGAGANRYVASAAAGGDVSVNVDVFEAADVTGTAGNDFLDFGSATANSILRGGAGNDTLVAGAGNDTLIGGSGDDNLFGGTGSDTASFARAGGAVSVTLAAGYAVQATGDGTDTLVSIENIVGSIYADKLTGDDGANTIDGGYGNDVLIGGGGADVLIGGLGSDRLDGGTGTDTASYADAATGVTVNLAISTAQVTGGAGTDTLISIECLTGSGFADVLTGNAVGNIISGGAGDDTLSGDGGNDAINAGAGNDILIGGSGSDKLGGGLGADTFRFASADAGSDFDTIVDFMHGTDHIELSRTAFAGLAALPAGALAASAFTLGVAATTADQHLIYDRASATLYYDADGSGAAAQTKLVVLTGAPLIDAGDFVLI